MIDHELIHHVARLARMELRPEEVDKFTHQLGEILDYVEKLAKVDTEGVEPATSAVDIQDVYRADESRDSFSIDKVMRNNPTGDPAVFRVPKILDS